MVHWDLSFGDGENKARLRQHDNDSICRLLHQALRPSLWTVAVYSPAENALTENLSFRTVIY